MIVLKKFANTATADYMNSREVRFLCVIKSTALTASFYKCLLLAKKHKLRMGRVVTTSTELSVDQQYVSYGDALLEIVGLSTAAKSKFYIEVNQIGPTVYVTESNEGSVSVFEYIVYYLVITNNSLYLFLFLCLCLANLSSVQIDQGRAK